MSVWEQRNDGELVGVDEFVLCTENRAYYYEGETLSGCDEGKLTLTTGNIFFQPMGAGPMLMRIPLEKIDNTDGGPSIVSQSGSNTRMLHIPLTGEPKLVKFSFKTGNVEDLCETLRDVLQQKFPATRGRSAAEQHPRQTPALTSFEVIKPVAKAPESAACSDPLPREPIFAVTDKAGIAGLMRVSAEKAALRETLHDIDDVMHKASSLVEFIRHLRQKQQSIAGDAQMEDNTAIESIEATLGLGAAVKSVGGTRRLVGAHAGFYDELALEIHSWLTHEKNQHVFGSMPLIPLNGLFSLYNKARGEVGLVSTGDVLHACRALEQKEYAQHTLKCLSSGRYALQRKDPAIVLKKLEHVLGPCFCKKQEPDSSVSGGTAPDTEKYIFPNSSSALKSINDVKFAAVLRVTRSVSMDLLEELEMQGYLCRSGGEFGCFAFHWNIFAFCH
uniref:Vacuolar protein-sorting-associated protein 36 n=1 Tax=Trypanosoma congolense (strain IL3000) TaxID=1068625 RepID=G0UYS5_TRYCI|nr:conserved hypothetical protein [Trypanosoma congolense IL3000]